MVRRTRVVSIDAGPRSGRRAAVRIDAVAARRARDATARHHPDHERGLPARRGQSLPPPRFDARVSLA